MKHYFSLLDFKKSFAQAQEYHRYAIQNGNEETKKAHLQHHLQSGNFDILANKKKPKGASNGY